MQSCRLLQSKVQALPSLTSSQIHNNDCICATRTARPQPPPIRVVLSSPGKKNQLIFPDPPPPLSLSLEQTCLCLQLQFEYNTTHPSKVRTRTDPIRVYCSAASPSTAHEPEASLLGRGTKESRGEGKKVHTFSFPPLFFFL